MSEPFRVLLIDDNPDDRVLVLRQLEREFPGLEVEQVLDAPGLVRALEAAPFELVITDYRLGWTTGVSVLRTVKARWPDCPVVMFTGTGSEEIAVEAMKAGLDDYVLKSPRHFVRLPVAARSALDRARQRRTVKESEERYWRLFDGLPVGLYLTGSDGQPIDANPALAEMLGFPSREAFLDARMGELYADPRDRERWRETMSREGVARGFEVRLRRRDGKVIWVRDTARAERDADGKVRWYEGSLEDVTERKRAEEQLRLLESAVRHAGEGIVITTPDSDPGGPVIVFANAAFERMTGWSARKAAGRSPWMLVGPSSDPGAVGRLREAMANGRALSEEISGLRQDGGEFDLEWHVAPIRDADGRVTHLVSIQRDVTERRTVEDRLRQSQKLEAMGRLAGGIAHDFNNLLTVIGGYADILREAAASDESFREHAETIIETAERASQLTHQLLAFSRTQVLEPRVHDLNDLIEEMGGLLGRVLGEDIGIVMKLDPDAGRVRVDAGQFSQVVVNLAVNAKDAMPEGGRLTITTAQAQEDGSHALGVPGLESGVYARLTVADTGHGMDAATLGRIFEPFFTTKPRGRGTGLGLSTVYGIVRQSGGHVRARSEPGVGSSFDVFLPVAPPPVPATGIEPASSAPTGSETVLLVEDEAGIRGLLAEVLERAGYRVLAAPGGPEALLRAAAHDGRIDLLVTDVVMPGMSGRDLAARLVATRPGMKVLFISGYMTDDVVRRGVSAADTEFLQKPFPPQAFLSKIRAVLDAPPR